MIAALAMYDWPELREETDAFWSAWRESLRARGVDAPETLTRGGAAEAVWTAPDLLVAQTCGYPLALGRCGAARPFAAFVRRVEGCAGVNYSSALVARRDDPRAELAAFRGARAAVNGRESQSGFNALRASVAALGGAAPFFESLAITGAHRASVRAVAEARADIAAIDAVAWALARTHEPAASRLNVIGWTAPTPGLPLIAGPGASIPLLRETLAEALDAAGGALRIERAMPVGAEEYAGLLRPDLERMALSG